MSLGEGFGGGLRAVQGGWVFLWKMRARVGGAGGGGWGGDRQRNRQVNARAFVKTTV